MTETKQQVHTKFLPTPTIIKVLLWTRRRPRSLTEGEKEFPYVFHEVMRQGYVAISEIEGIHGREEPVRSVIVTPDGYELLARYRPKEFR